MSIRDAEAIGISQLGARRRLVRAIQRLATTLPPSPLPHPHLTPQHIGSPYGAMPHGLVGSPGDMDDDALSPNSKKKRGPMRCGKCHQWKKTCHGHCTVRCTSFATCPTRHRRAHPELKEEEKEQRRREEEERKRKRDDEKEEKRREKKVRNEEEQEEEEGDVIANGVDLNVSASDVVLMENGQALVVPPEATHQQHQLHLQHPYHHHQHQQHQQHQHQLQQPQPLQLHQPQHHPQQPQVQHHQQQPSQQQQPQQVQQPVQPPPLDNQTA